MVTRLSPPPLWDEMLRQVPCHLLLFDAALVCRYAAPHGDQLLGRRRDDLLDRHATEILPRELGLTGLLSAALEANVDLRAEVCAPDAAGEGIDGGWRICVKSVSAGASRVVLVVMFDVRDLLDELRAAREECEKHRVAEEERREATRELYTDIRTLLTPIQGYLQLMARRPAALAGRERGDLIEAEILPAVHRLTELIERLPEESAPRTPHPRPAPAPAPTPPRDTQVRPSAAPTVNVPRASGMQPAMRRPLSR